MRLMPDSCELDLARQLWTMGGGHVIGTEAVVERARRYVEEVGAEDPEQVIFNGKYSASIHLLIGYAFELLLKSAYLAHGGDPKKLGSRGIGHDLVVALDKAEACGFKSQVEHLRWIVERVREPHLAHQFRYGGMEKIEMPDLKHTLEAMNGLAYELQVLLYPEGR